MSTNGGAAVTGGPSDAISEAVFEHAAVGVAVVESVSGRVVRANRRYAELTGHGPDALAATNVFRLTHDDDLAAFVRRVSALASGRDVQATIDVRRLAADGSTVPVHLALAPLPDANGDARHHVEVAVDVAARSAAEAYMRAIIATVPVCVKLLGGHGELLDMNPAGLAMIEAESFDEVRGRRMSDLVMEADRPAFEGAIAAAATGRCTTVRFQIEGLRGVRRHMRGHVAPFRDGGGGDAAAVALAVIEDVTEAHRTSLALARSQERLAATMQVAGVGTFEVEIGSGAAHWSPDLFSVYGRDPAVGVPRDREFYTLVHPDDHEAIGTAFRRVAETGEPARIDFRSSPARGPLRHWAAVMTRVEDADGARVLGTVQDITDRKRTEEQLRESRERLDGMLASLSDVVWSAAPDDFRVGFMSAAAERLFGWPAQCFLDDPDLCMATTHPDDAGVQESSRAQLLRDGAMDLEYRIVRRDGATRWVRNRARVVRDAEGRPVRIDGIITDLTEQKEAIEALRVSERRFRQLVESAWDVTVLVDADGVIVYASESITRVLGRSLADYLGRSAVDFAHPGDQPAERLERLATIRAGGAPSRLVYRAVHEDGSTRWVEIVARSCLDDPAVGAIVVNVRDVTERRAAEEQLRELTFALEQRVRERTEELEAANAELEAFSYTVSHDLRAPLRAIDGFTHILSEEEGASLSPDAHHCIARIRQSTRRMAELIDDLLRFSHLGRQPLVRGPVDMRAVVGWAWEQLASERAPRRVEFRLGDLPPCIGDASLLQQVMLNLLSNALKFTRDRAIAHIDVGWNDGYYVRDDGVGFEEGYAEKLFDVFQRLHGEAYDGTGVGLAIVERIVSRHGGTIRAEGRPGEGATFSFTVPPDPTG